MAKPSEDNKPKDKDNSSNDTQAKIDRVRDKIEKAGPGRSGLNPHHDR